MKQIFVLGSINIDYVTEIDRIPDNGETLHGNKFFSNYGGKGANQAIACARQNVETNFIGCVGNDIVGRNLIDHLNRNNINTECVEIADDNTGSAIIIIQNQDNRILINQGANGKITCNSVDKGLLNANKGDYLLVQLEINLDIVEYAIRVAKNKQMITVLNAAPAKQIKKEIFRYIDYLIVNEIESKMITGTENHEEALLIFENMGVKNTIITLGERGAKSKDVHVGAYKVEVVDTTAAGDTYVGALVAKLSEGNSFYEAMKYANAAAVLTITSYGAQQSIPTKEKIEVFIETKR